MLKSLNRKRFKGFTLAELLIALAILGVIATFAIPKVLQSIQNTQQNAIAKEVAATISGAFQSYKLNNTVSSSTTFHDVTPYINYVKIVGAPKQIDNLPNAGTTNAFCTFPAQPCLALSNGSYLMYYFSGDSFSDETIYVTVDPDGTVEGNKESVSFVLRSTGSVTTLGAYQSNPTNDPPWFSWN